MTSHLQFQKVPHLLHQPISLSLRQAGSSCHSILVRPANNILYNENASFGLGNQSPILPPFGGVLCTYSVNDPLVLYFTFLFFGAK